MTARKEKYVIKTMSVKKVRKSNFIFLTDINLTLIQNLCPNCNEFIMVPYFPETLPAPPLPSRCKMNSHCKDREICEDGTCVHGKKLYFLFLANINCTDYSLFLRQTNKILSKY